MYAACGPDLVMERLDGPTMAAALLTGDPPRRLDDAVALRRRHATLSVAEIDELPEAAAGVRGVG